MASLDAIVEKCDMTNNKDLIKAMSRKNKQLMVNQTNKLKEQVDRVNNTDYEWDSNFHTQFHGPDAVKNVKK